MSFELHHPLPEEEKVAELSDILTKGSKAQQLDNRIWKYSSWKIDPFA